MYSYTLRTLKTAMSNQLKNPRHFGIPRFKTTMDVDNQGSYTSGAHVCEISEDGKYLRVCKFKRFKLGLIEMANHYHSDGSLYIVTFKHYSSDSWYLLFFYV